MTAGPPLELDALGQRCPLPVILLARHIDSVAPGSLVVVVADDEAARLDIPAWCRMRGHEFLEEQPRPRGSAYVVRRAR